MLRALFLVSVAATIGVATPAAAWDIDAGDCSGLTVAFTESPDTHVDLYMADVVKPEDVPNHVDEEWIKDRITEALLSAEDLFEPGEVGRGDLIAQFELQIGQHDEPGLSGIRFTYMVNVSSCTGL